MQRKNKRQIIKNALSLVMNAMFPTNLEKSNRPCTRSMKCERLESRQLYAADAFVGIYNNGTWTLSDTPAVQVSFGLPGDQPVMGDWNGDGREKPGIYRNGTWVLDLTGNGFDTNDRVLEFGLPGDKAVAGDWDGDGIDTVGVFRNGAWFMDRNGNGYDAADVDPVFFGWGSDTPVPGDWDGDGKDSPGIFRAGTWALDLTGNGFDAGDRFLQFGLPGDQPISGDWNRDGKDTPAVLQKNSWYFDLEGDGYTGEKGMPNRFGTGIAVVGESSIGPRPTAPPPAIATPPSGAWGVRPLFLPETPEVDVDGIADGQSKAVTFGSVNVGSTAIRDFTVRNTGRATLILGNVQVPAGFTLVSDLPRSLAPNASATFRVSMNTSTAGFRNGMLSFATNDSNESEYDFTISGTVNQVITQNPSGSNGSDSNQGGRYDGGSQSNNGNNGSSPTQGGNSGNSNFSNAGTVISSQKYIGSSGSMIIKTVQTYGANGNNLRLYTDFLSPSGSPIRTDVLIGNPNNSFGDQTMPQATALDLGRYVIAWRSTSPSNRSEIHYSIVDANGATVGEADRIANIGFSTNLELRNVSTTRNGFQISWLDRSNNRTVRRDFNMAGT